MAGSRGPRRPGSPQIPPGTLPRWRNETNAEAVSATPGTLGCPQPYAVDVPVIVPSGHEPAPGTLPTPQEAPVFLQNPRGLVLFPPCGLVWGEKCFPSCVPGSWSRHFPHRGEAGGVRQGVGGLSSPRQCLSGRLGTRMGAQGRKEMPAP